MGEPMVWQWRTPDDNGDAVGLDLHAPAAAETLLPPPEFMIDRIHSIGMPAGSPVRVATRHSPWDSPAVSNRNMEEMARFARNPIVTKPNPFIKLGAGAAA